MTEKSYDRIVAFILENKDNFYRLAYLNIDNQELALNMVEKSVRHALKRSGTLHNNMAIKVWFYQILLDECRNMERTAKKITDISIVESDKEDSENDILHRIRRLDFEHRMILILYHFEGFAEDEIARIMRIEQHRVELCLSELLQIL